MRLWSALPRTIHTTTTTTTTATCAGSEATFGVLHAALQLLKKALDRTPDEGRKHARFQLSQQCVQIWHLLLQAMAPV
jgi:hypothetical protein